MVNKLCLQITYHSCFSDVYISQGSVAMHFGHGGVFND